METNNYTNEQKYIRAQKRAKDIKGFYIHLMVYLIVNIFLLLLQAISGSGWHVFTSWASYTTAFFWGIGIVFHAFGVFGVNILFGKNWEERKIKEYMEKDKREFWE